MRGNEKKNCYNLAFCLMLPALILFSVCGNNASNNVEVDEFITIANQTTTVLKTRCARDASQSLTMGRDVLKMKGIYNILRRFYA